MLTNKQRKKEKMMKRRKSIGLIIMTAVLSLCTVFGIQSIQASAATIYTSSEKDYWMITDGSGDYTVSLDNAATMQPTYKGVETVVTPADGVEDIGITLKGMVNPMSEMIIKHDNQQEGVADADAIVYSFTSLTDPDRQISVIATHRSNRTWYTFALTDELEVRDGYTYIEGTEQKTIGYRDLISYDSLGYCAWSEGEYHWGAIYHGDLLFKIGTDGGIYYNRSLVIGNVTNADFLSLSKASLAGTKYEERYTSEYIAETLTQLAKGARMEIKWYGVKTDKVDFHIRGINGSWIGDNGGNGLEYNLGVKHSTIIYKKVNTLYVGETYQLSDLLYGGGYEFRNAENANAKLNLSGWYANSVNKTAGNNSDSTWYNALTQMNKTVTMNEVGTYSMTMNGSFLGYYHSTDFTTSFTFDVVNKTPVFYQAFGETLGSLEVERWTEITLVTPTEEQLQAVPDGYEFIGWEMGDSTYAPGSVYTVNGNGTEVVFSAKLNDVQKPVITVGDYTESYYDGDELTLLSATVSDNSGENIEATVAVSKDGENVAVTDNKAALNAGTYMITYTAKDSAGNEADAITKTVVVKEKTAVVYSDGANTIATEAYKPGEITLATFNTEDVAEGYEFAGWKLGEEVYEAGASYTLGETPVTFVASFDAIEYTVTLDYAEEGKADEVITFTIENRTEKLAEIKAKLPISNDGYGYSWQDLPATLPLENVTYVEVLGAIVYTITFEGVEDVEPIKFTVETKDEIFLPVLEEREGYTCAWDKTLADIGLADITFTAVYSAIECTVTLNYVEEGKADEVITFTIENREEKLAEIQAKQSAVEGYTFSWKDLPASLPLENVTFEEVATAIVYTITFEGVEGVEPITFTVETKSEIVLPILEEKAGYTCAWDKTVSELGLEDVTLTAVYEVIEYTATVVVNSTETQVTYTIENREAKLTDIIAMKPVADNEYYIYVWENALPEELPLENGRVYKVIRQDVEKPDDSANSDSSDTSNDSTNDSANTSESNEESDDNKSSGCFGSIGGLSASLVLAFGAVCLLKKKENKQD